MGGVAILILVVEKVRKLDRARGAARGAMALARGAAARRDRAIEAIVNVVRSCRQRGRERN